MRPKNKRTGQISRQVLCTCLLLIVLLSSCVSPASTNNSVQNSYPQAEVIFKVSLVQALPEGATLSLEVVDDVTGLAFNPQRYEMTKHDDLNYFVKLPLVIGSVLKYRYVKVSETNSVEYTPQSTAVRFRIANISGPAIFQDIVAGWIDQPYIGVIGRVRGQFLDKTTNSPIPNLLVTAQGVQTVTSSDGTFTLEGLTLGTHNLAVYSMDGKYDTFQQGVAVAEEATTPVFISLQPRPTISVTFEVSTPTDFDQSIPIRFASNLQPLGNLYTDLLAGSTTVSSTLPVLNRLQDGKYSITLDLPVGFDLRYKFTLGDGLWNSELNTDGSFILRELIVKQDQTKIEDTVATFRSPGLEPVTFSVITPSITPAEDVISLQLNPYTWFESIPMVRKSQNEWSYTLYSPLHLLGPVEYRFCRNEVCDLSSGVPTTAQLFSPSNSSQVISVRIDQWNNYASFGEPEIITDGGNTTPRSPFISGFELISEYVPFTSQYLDLGLTMISGTAANFVIIPSTWTATRNNPPYLEPLPGQDYSWSQMSAAINSIQDQGMQAILFPQVRFPMGATDYWQNAKRDEGWWITWYENYHRYILQVVDWAAANNVGGIIIGDPSVAASFKNGTLADGSLAGAPLNADEQWQQLIKDMRTKFSGAIIGALAYPSSQKIEPGWLDSVDAIYVLYSPTLSQSSSISTNDLMSLIRKDLDDSLYPKISGFGKIIILGLNYPSASNAFGGCVDVLGSCMNNWGNSQVDLNVQSQIYNAAVIIAAKESWITGFISRNYQPIVALQDSSSSLNGKPAIDVLWFWYHFILNVSS